MNNFTHYSLKKDFCRRKYFFIDPQPPTCLTAEKSAGLSVKKVACRCSLNVTGTSRNIGQWVS